MCIKLVRKQKDRKGDKDPFISIGLWLKPNKTEQRQQQQNKDKEEDNVIWLSFNILQNQHHCYLVISLWNRDKRFWRKELSENTKLWKEWTENVDGVH